MAMTGAAAASQGATSRNEPAAAADVRAPAGWEALAARADPGNVFFHPAFLEPAAEALHAAPGFAVARDASGRAVGLAPLVPARLGRIAPALAVWTHDYAPAGMPLVEPGAGAAGALVGEALAMAGPRRALIVPYLPADGSLMAAAEAVARADGRATRRIDAHLRAALDREIDGTDPRAALIPRRRKEYARQMRRLGEAGAVAVAVAHRPAAVAAAFEEFLALEAAGWKGRSGTAMARLPAVAAFARRAVTGLAAAGLCRILTLRAGETPAAIVVCLMAGATATTWKIAYDESLSRFSPGAQLMLEAPPILFSDPAIRRIDSCAAPNHPMIDHLWRGRLALATLVIAPRKGRLLHRAGLVVHSGEQKARGLARRLRGRAARGQEVQP